MGGKVAALVILNLILIGSGTALSVECLDCVTVYVYGPMPMTSMTAFDVTMAMSSHGSQLSVRLGLTLTVRGRMYSQFGLGHSFPAIFPL